MQLVSSIGAACKVHRSSGLQKPQAIRMTPRSITSKAKNAPFIARIKTRHPARYEVLLPGSDQISLIR